MDKGMLIPSNARLASSPGVKNTSQSFGVYERNGHRKDTGKSLFWRPYYVVVVSLYYYAPSPSSHTPSADGHPHVGCVLCNPGRKKEWERHKLPLD